MKTSLSSFALVLALAGTAQAGCPELTGTYSCIGESGQGLHFEFKKLASNVYQLEDQLWIRASEAGAENVTQGKDYKMLITATCRNQVLDVETEISNPEDGQFLSFVQKSYLPKPSGDVDVLMTWNNSRRFESTLIRCLKKMTSDIY